MDSFLRDVAAATSGAAAAPGTSQEGADIKPSIVEKVTLLGGEEKAGAGHEAEARAEPTAEEQKQMMDFLASLEKMKDSDPEQFNAVMESITGVKAGSAAPVGGADAASLSSIMQAVQGLRQGAADAGPGSIHMPGAKKEAQKGIKIMPEPGFSFKTRLAAEAEGEAGKIFINICVHEKISVPGLKKRLNAEGEEEEGMNIPMSVGVGRRGADKSGVACMIYDIVVNPVVVEESETDRSGKYRDFVCQLGMQCVEQKYGLVLDRRYKLPKLKYMGEPEPQLIVDRSQGPIIEEVAKGSATAKKLAAAKLAKEQEEAKAAAAARAKLEKDLPYSAYYAVHGTADDAANEEISLLQSEYKEPTAVPAAQFNSIVFRAEIEAYGADHTKMAVKASPFLLFVKLPGFKPVTVYLPCAVDATRLSCSLKKREGFVSLIDLAVEMPLDRSEWGSVTDPGSKQWLLSRALTSDAESETYNPYAVSSASGEAKGEGDSQAKQVVNDDPFHLRVPVPVAPVEANVAVAADDGDLPEDRFHKKDASSQYYVNLREQGVQDKWDKHRKEKEEREKNPDPNVEYIDVDDFKVGGKLGPKNEIIENANREKEAEADEKRKAAELVASLAPTAVEGLSSAWADLI